MENKVNWQRDFPITRKWPPNHSDRIQLYSFGTPNGVKIPIALEELGLSYEVHRVHLNDENVKSPEFLSLSPNNKIPALIDPDGPDGKAMGLFESAAILEYLATKTGRLIGLNQTQRYEILSWLMFQIGSVGPMFGQFGFFHAFGGKTSKTHVHESATWAKFKGFLASLIANWKIATGSREITRLPISRSGLGCRASRVSTKPKTSPDTSSFPAS